MTAGNPFGFGLPANLKPEDIAALMSRVPMGAPQGFTPQEASQTEPLETQAPLIATPEMRPSPIPPRPPAAGGQPPEQNTPSPSAEPTTTGAIPFGTPVAPPRPAAPQPESGAAGFAQKWKDLADTGIFDQGLAFAGGLLSAPGGEGWGRAFDNMSRASATTAATDLARAKTARETTALTGNAAFVKRVFAGRGQNLSDQEAMAIGSNAGAMSSLISSQQRSPQLVSTTLPDGRTQQQWLTPGESAGVPVGAPKNEKDDIQLVTRPDGSIVGVNKSKIADPAEAGSVGAVTTVVPGSEEDAKVAQRRQAVIAQGHDPNDGRYADYILSGTLPKENQQLLTAADKKAIMEGEDSILAHKNTLTQLSRAADLSKKAYDGAGASQRAMVVSNVPEMLGGHTPESLATRELDNVVTGQALDNLKATFGGAPTEGERAILLQVQGSANMPQALREQVFRNAMAKVQQKLDFEQQRVDQLRGGSYYKQGGGGLPAGGAPAQPAPQEAPAAAPPVPTERPAASAQPVDPLSAARAAISHGADPAKVKTRLLKAGIDPRGL